MSWEIRQGHVLTRLADLADESVHCVVTSPPYWGLRDYGTAVWDGGREDCDHIASELRKGVNLRQSAASTRGGAIKVAEVGGVPYRDVCGKCGARRVDEQIGLEATPEEYVGRLVGVFREVRRVLRSDGVCWLNIGDCYATGAGAVGEAPGGGEQGERWRQYGPAGNRTPSGKHAQLDGRVPRTQPNRMPIPGLKPKDLVMVPARLALALQADGWWVRSEVVWSKPNPMPESVEDRPTSAHEKVFLLAKSARYFYDAHAIREASTYPDDDRKARSDATRNRRNVWEVATVSFPDAHFAVFPPKLVEPAVLAGSAPKVCGSCGAPWRRIIERSIAPGSRRQQPEVPQASQNGQGRNGVDSDTFGEYQEVRTLGWEATCGHGDDSGRAVVLDPFAGSGTVGVVCEWHGRDFIGLELNEEYVRMARRRIAAEGPLGRPARRPRPLPDDHATLFDLT